MPDKTNIQDNVELLSWLRNQDGTLVMENEKDLSLYGVGSAIKNLPKWKGKKVHGVMRAGLKMTEDHVVGCSRILAEKETPGPDTIHELVTKLYEMAEAHNKSNTGS